MHLGLVLVQSLESLKRKKRKIKNVQLWAEALMVYVAITSHPDVANLMAYGVIINQMAREQTSER